MSLVVQDEIINSELIRKINGSKLHSLTFVNCTLDPETKDFFTTESSRITELVFKHMPVAPLHLFKKNVLEHVKRLFFCHCKSIKGVYDLWALEELHFRFCGSEIIGNLLNLSKSMVRLEVEGPLNLDVPLLHNSRLKMLLLIQMTPNQIFEALHTLKIQSALVSSLNSLVLSWNINYFPIHKQLHLNRFARLEHLAIENMPADAISTRNLFSSLKTLTIWVREFTVISNVFKKYCGSHCDVTLNVQDATKRFDQFSGIQVNHLIE